jgi:hypothetical protein
VSTLNNIAINVLEYPPHHGRRECLIESFWNLPIVVTFQDEFPDSVDSISLVFHKIYFHGVNRGRLKSNL